MQTTEQLQEAQKWQNDGDGRFTFTGSNLDKVPDDIKEKMIHLRAPNLVGKLKLSDLPALEKIDAPTADVLHFWYLPSLKTVNAANASSVHAGFCEELQRIDIPKVTKVTAGVKVTKVTTGVNVSYTRHYPSAMTDVLIKAVNPKKIETFNLLYPSAVGDPNDIAPCIKDADRELNGNDGAKINRANIVRDNLKHSKIESFHRTSNECNPKEHNKEKSEEKIIDQELVGKLKSSNAATFIGEYLEQKEIHKFYFLQRNSYHPLSEEGVPVIKQKSNLSDYANLGKTNIVAKTHAHTAAREVINGIINGVR